ncbi:hypothetical protein C8R43DRAFT_865381, partial [Mycena crocata]
DIDCVASVTKTWLRELPKALFIMVSRRQEFIDAASEFLILYFPKSRIRNIRFRELVEDLPDLNYATLKYFL